MLIHHSPILPRPARGGIVVFALALVVVRALPEEHPGLYRGVQFRADSSLVLVPVTVTHRRGATITDLRPDEFTLLADNRTQPIAAFYRDDAPSAIGIVLDISGSVEAGIAREKAGSAGLPRGSERASLPSERKHRLHPETPPCKGDLQASS